MRTGSSNIRSVGRSSRSRGETRLKNARKTQDRWIGLERLESRTLLATIPAPAPTVVNGTAEGPVDLTGFSTVPTSGNANSPTVVVDPYDSQKIVAVWSVNLAQEVPAPSPTTAIVEGAYSSDGGLEWFGFNASPVLPDPLALAGDGYTQVTEPSAAFDSAGNFYVLTLQTTGLSQATGVSADGAIQLSKFNFSGSSPTSVNLPNSGVVYQWVTGSDAATSPALAVDSGTVPFGTAPPAGVPVDPFANNVYIAWPASTLNRPRPRPEFPLTQTGPSWSLARRSVRRRPVSRHWRSVA